MTKETMERGIQEIAPDLVEHARYENFNKHPTAEKRSPAEDGGAVREIVSSRRPNGHKTAAALAAALAVVVAISALAVWKPFSAKRGTGAAAPGESAVEMESRAEDRRDPTNGNNSQATEDSFTRDAAQTFFATVETNAGKSILVKGLTENNINFRGAFWLTISEQTAVTRDGNPIDVSALTPGSEVRVTFTGEVMESYPAQIAHVQEIALLDQKQTAPMVLTQRVTARVDQNDATGLTAIVCQDRDPNGLNFVASVRLCPDEGTRITHNGAEIPISALTPGSYLSVVFDGAISIMEDAENRIEDISEIELLSEGTGNGETNVEQGHTELAELYLTVLKDLWDLDPTLNAGAERIGVDLSSLTDLTEAERLWVCERFSLAVGLPYLPETWEKLCEHGDIDRENLVWEDGVFFCIRTDENAVWNLPNMPEGERELTAFTAEKWCSGEGAIWLHGCTAWKTPDGSWTYTVGAQAVS